MNSDRAKSWQELGDEFHLMIGNCIAAWAEADDELFRIFRDCIGPYEQCAIIYYRMPGLDVRLGCTGELVESVLPKPARKSGGHPHPSIKEWREIQGTFKKLLAIRRRIAHHPVTIRLSPNRNVALKKINKKAFSIRGLDAESWFEIYMGEHEQLRFGEEIKGLTIDDLKKHSTEAVHLRDGLRKFYFTHLAKISPLAKPSRPEIQPLLAQLKQENPRL